MIEIQNIRKGHEPSIINYDNLRKFIEILNQIYDAPELNKTHTTQLFRTKFYLKTNDIKKISLQIFSNGTIYFEGSPKIPKQVFDKEVEQILQLAKSLAE